MKKVILYLLVTVGLAILFGFEIASVYYIMPFPGSQRQESIDFAYYLVNHIHYFRVVGIFLLLYPVFHFIRRGTTTHRVLVGSVALLYLMIYYQVNYRMQADVMFLQPGQVNLVGSDENKVKRRKLIIGVAYQGQARAYPIEIIGYHHQVRDTIAGNPIMVTYCTVCRTGRVYKPIVKNEPDSFRLVGMDHFNAMFEDSRTKSWWRQVSGEAIAGPLKGSLLDEIPSQQMSLLAWIDRHPNTLILQADSTFNEAYQGLEKFDEGTIESGLERRDTLSWQEKSWVIGVQLGMTSKAYDWNNLLAHRVINDSIGNTPVLLTLEPDSLSFHSWNRDSLTFSVQDGYLQDHQTLSRWNWRGQCVEGRLTGAQLNPIQSYQEFWHSWQTFHPTTLRFQPH